MQPQAKETTILHLNRRRRQLVASSYNSEGKLISRKECETATLELSVKRETRIRIPSTLAQDIIVLIIEGGAKVECTEPTTKLEV